MLRLGLVVLISWLASSTWAQADYPVSAFAPPPPQAYFADEQAWVAYALRRVSLLGALEEGVREEGRTTAFGFKRLLSLGAILAGGILLTTGFSDMLDNAQENNDRLGPLSETVAGLVLAGVGIGTTIMLQRRKPYRRQELALRSERIGLQQQLQSLGIQQGYDYGPSSELAPAPPRLRLAHRDSSVWQRAEVSVGPAAASLRLRF